jgi:hypothetical protein
MAYDPKVIGPRFIAWLKQDTGKQNITLKTSLSSIGFDGFNIYPLGQQIDELSWLHGVNITPTEIAACKDVNDVVQLICK